MNLVNMWIVKNLDPEVSYSPMHLLCLKLCTWVSLPTLGRAAAQVDLLTQNPPTLPSPGDEIAGAGVSTSASSLKTRVSVKLLPSSLQMVVSAVFKGSILPLNTTFHLACFQDKIFLIHTPPSLESFFLRLCFPG